MHLLNHLRKFSSVQCDQVSFSSTAPRSSSCHSSPTSGPSAGAPCPLHHHNPNRRSFCRCSLAPSILQAPTAGPSTDAPLPPPSPQSPSSGPSLSQPTLGAPSKAPSLKPSPAPSLPNIGSPVTFNFPSLSSNSKSFTFSETPGNTPAPSNNLPVLKQQKQTKYFISYH